MTTGRAFRATSDSENCTPSLLPQMIPATRATKPATLQTMTQMRFSGMPMDCAAWWSSATARRARPVAGLLEEQAQHGHQRGGNDRGDEVFLVDQDAALEDALEQEDRVLGQADVDLVDVAAEDGLARSHRGSR